MLLTETFGWLGTFLIILAYYLNSTQKISSQSSTYQLLNLCGAIGVGINVFTQHAWPAFALQIVWAFIAISAIIKKKT